MYKEFVEWASEKAAASPLTKGDDESKVTEEQWPAFRDRTPTGTPEANIQWDQSTRLDGAWRALEGCQTDHGLGQREVWWR